MALSRSKKQERLSAAFARLPDSAQIMLQELAAKGVGLDAPDVLAFFNRIARRLPQDQRTVTAFTTPQDLAQAISQSVQDWALPQLAAQTAAQEWNKVISPAAQDEFRLLAIANALSAADPDNLRSVPQIIHWLQTDTNRALPEDLPGIRADLKAFERIKPDLEPVARDVTAYPHIHDLRATLPKTAYSQDQRKAYEAQALQNDEAKLLWQDEHNHACLIRITSESGAQRLGRGTDWCTAWGGPGDPNKKSKFTTYSNNLLYWRIGAEVYQLHFSTAQFKDAQDQDVELKSLVTACPEATAALRGPLSEEINIFAQSEAIYKITSLLSIWSKTGGQNLQETTYSVIRPIISQACLMAAKNGWTDNIADLLNNCHKTGDKKLQQMAYSTVMPFFNQTFRVAAKEGWATSIAILLNACHQTGNHKLQKAAYSAVTPVLSPAFQNAAQKGWIDNTAALLTACYKTEDQHLRQAAICAVTPTLNQACRWSAESWKTDYMTELLTACHQTGETVIIRGVRDIISATDVRTRLNNMARTSRTLRATLSLWEQPETRPQLSLSL